MRFVALLGFTAVTTIAVFTLPLPGAALATPVLAGPGFTLAAECQCPCLKCGGGSGLACVASSTATTCLKTYDSTPVPHISCLTDNCGD